MPVTRRTVQAAFGLVALTAFLLVFGSTVRVHGAGLSCPDWPLCFGRVVPAYEFKTYLEFGHRVVAGFVSLGFLGLWAQVVRSGAWAESVALRRLFPLAAAVLAVQVVLGGLTVLELLAEWTVASHLVTGDTFCATLLVIALQLRELHAPTPRAGVTGLQRAATLLVAVLVPSQIVLGGLVAGSHAGLACGTWPGCNGAAWFPTFEGLVGLQVMHRALAYTVATAVLLNLALQWSNLRSRRVALGLSALVLVQIAIGVSNVLLALPMEVTLLHSAGAAALWLCTAWQGFEVFTAPLLVSAPQRSQGGAAGALPSTARSAGVR